MRAHGNWCGPNWTAGKHKPTSELTDEDRNVPAIDALDEACKAHDIQLHDMPENADEINKIFINTVKSMGVQGALFALAVGIAGPSPSTEDPMYGELRQIQHENNVRRKELNTYNTLLNLPQTTDMPVRQVQRKDFEHISTRLRRRGDRRQNPNNIAEEFVDAFGHLRHKSPDAISDQITQPLPNIPPFPELESTMRDNNDDVNMESSSRSAGGETSTSKVSQETAVIYQKPKYLLPDTFTVEMPVTLYFSGILPDNGALDFTFAANSIKTILKTLITSPANDISTNLGAGFSAGLFNQKLIVSTDTIPRTMTPVIANTDVGIFYQTGNSPTNSHYTVEGRNFPINITTSGQPMVKNREWYDKMYQYYTVLNCDYALTLQPTLPHVHLNNDLLLGTTIDVYTGGSNSNQIPLNSSLPYAQYWNGITWQILDANNYLDTASSKYCHITGSYKPGTSKRMVENDGDAKLWTKKDENPVLSEDVHLMFFAHPLNTVHGTPVLRRTNDTTGTTNYRLQSSFNAELKLKYLVQYKDLVREYSYFNGTAVPALNLLHSEFTAIAGQNVPGTL
jgi:hypothetical protein